MLSFSRRLKSSLVKAQASNALNNVIQDKKQFYELADFQTSNLKDFFDKNGLMFPVDTIIEKYKAEDFDFFLTKGNFLKVADTLEKFASNLDMDHEDARKFILFKKKLYKLYEVRARSVHEHAQFSTEIREDELTHVYAAHRHHLANLATDSYIDRVAQQLNLKGAFYRRKLMSPQKLRGLTSGLFALSIYAYNPYLWPYFASNFILAKLYSATPIAAALYSGYNFYERDIVNSISRVDSGSDKGKVKLSISVYPFVTRDIIADPKDIVSGGTAGDTGLSAIKVSRGYDAHTRADFEKERIYAIDTGSDGNAWIDREGMDWLLQRKSEGPSETDDLYADLIHERAKKLAEAKRVKKDFFQEIKYAIER